MNITVYLGANEGNDPSIAKSARELGAWIGKSGNNLVYGGSKVGLMGILAENALAAGAQVTGVEPQFFIDQAVQLDTITRLIVTDTMAERKAAMIAHADAFVMAPGGFGTFEEFFEVLTLKQLGRHNPAIAILNTNGFYDKMQAFVLSAVEQNFIRPACLNIYALCPTPADTLTYLEQYDPAALDVRHLKNI